MRGVGVGGRMCAWLGGIGELGLGEVYEGAVRSGEWDARVALRTKGSFESRAQKKA